MFDFGNYDIIKTSDIPKNLREFVNYKFSSGPYTGDDFKSFNRKFKNAIKNMLPTGYSLHSWNSGHYYCSGVIKDDKERFIYFSISDVRDWTNGWINDILIRTMKHDKDWTGGMNNRTTIANFGKDIMCLYR